MQWLYLFANVLLCNFKFNSYGILMPWIFLYSGFLCFKNKEKILLTIARSKKGEDCLDEKYMARALELAKLGTGYTSPNPMVGCVIVKEGRNHRGEGWHMKIMVTFMQKEMHFKFKRRYERSRTLCNFRTLLSLWENITLY